MRSLFILFISLCCFTSAVIGGCVNGYYNGLPCASTTRYYDGQEGACGCGNSNGPFSWQYTQYTGAGSPSVFNPADGSVSWCGSGCGKCFAITPTGDCPTGGNCGGSNPHTTIVIMVTNLCPTSGNSQWCPPVGQTNSYGYSAHFDLMNANSGGLITALGWDNPAVTYQEVPCSSGSSLTPTCSEASQCVCNTQANMQTNCKAGTTPATSAPTARPATSAPTTKPTGLVVYTDSLQNGFVSWSWSTSYSLSDTTHVHSGSDAIRFDIMGYQGLYFHRDATFTINSYANLVFYVYSTQSVAASYYLQLNVYNAASSPTSTGNTVQPAGQLVANQWTTITVPTSSFGVGSTPLTGLVIQAAQNSDQGNIWIDDISFH